MSNEADCRTAPATPGLLNIGFQKILNTYIFMRKGLNIKDTIRNGKSHDTRTI